MWRLAMRIYEWLSARPAAKWWILSATLLLLTLPLINLQYKENIAEFIPQSGNYLERMEVFQQMSSADKTFVLFSIKNEAQEQKAPLDAQEQNAPLLAEAVDLFAERLAAADSSHLVKEIVKEVDYARYKALIPFIYSHVPYLLSAEDIARTDSLLSTPGFIEERLMERSAELMLPTGSFLSSSFEWDPLGLFSSVAETQLSTSSIPNCALYNGHIFTPDWRYALCIIASEGDPNESSTNKRLINLIEQAAKIDGITAEHIGAPSIAVGNATRIKRDSILALSLALLLITILLHFTLKSLRDLLLIVATLAFGWLCGLSAVAVAEQSVSMIVVGIASIILGIAANYPLHLITHTYHCRGRVGESLRQVVSPLITGNITTVGAFCALIPLNSPALRDLGIFAAAMLVGTILFTIVILPHLIKHKASSSAPDTSSTDASAPQTCTPDASAPYSSAPNADAPASGITAACRRANVWKRAQTPLIIAATLATLVLGYFGASTRFNPNLQEINYMTQRQRELMQQLSSLADLPSGRETLYIYNSNAAEEPAGELAGELAGTPAREAAAVPAQMPADTNECLLQGAESIYEALIGMPELRNAGAEVSSIAQIVPSKRSQQERLEAWGRLMERHRQTLAERLPKAAESAGFAGNAFSNFFSVIEKEYEIIEPTSFAQLLAGRGASMFKEGERCVTTVTLPQEAGDSLQSLISSKVAGLFEGSGQRVSLFNVKELSSAISESLSADFNYIGLSCSLIVFIFLWLSLRRLSYAIIAFMPMVVSWIWILGIMNLFGIEFNLVNIILATFIFGQGDDYSIFITEGLIYEDKYGKKIIGSFRESIYISAAIMFIGMGTLIVAKHPALSSLGEITVLGMAAVVLFSCTLPPLLFRLFRRVGIIRSAGIVKGV